MQKHKFSGITKNFIRSKNKKKINKMLNKKANFKITNDITENKRILIPKSTLTLEWSESALNPFASPKNMTGFKSRRSKNNKINGFTSLKNIQIVNNVNFQNNNYNDQIKKTNKWFMKSENRKTQGKIKTKNFFKNFKTNERFSTKNERKGGIRKTSDFFR